MNIKKKLIKLFLPRKIRKELEKREDFKIQEEVAQYWRGVLKDYFENEKNIEINVKPRKQLENTKIIWQFWAQGWNYDELPDIVKICYLSIEKYKGEYIIIRLDENTMHDYLEIPEYIMEKVKSKKLGYAQFSDILRLALLYNYGGVWLDATIYLTDFLPKKFFDMDYFLYQRDYSIAIEERKKYKKWDSSYFLWDKRHRVNILNSIIFSKKNGDLVKILLSLLLYFWKNNSEVKHYYIFQILYNELIDLYYSGKRCEIISDVLPHELYFNLLKKYDDTIFKEIINKISIHKLNFKLEYDKEKISSTILEYLLVENKI